MCRSGSAAVRLDRPVPNDVFANLPGEWLAEAFVWAVTPGVSATAPRMRQRKAAPGLSFRCWTLVRGACTGTGNPSDSRRLGLASGSARLDGDRGHSARQCLPPLLRIMDSGSSRLARRPATPVAHHGRGWSRCHGSAGLENLRTGALSALLLLPEREGQVTRPKAARRSAPRAIRRCYRPQTQARLCRDWRPHGR
jgi:hypothetical protein